MCKVKDINECEKRVFINTADGNFYYSNWFTDSDEKSDVTNSTLQELEEKENLKERFSIDEDDIVEWSVNRNKDSNVIYISDHAFKRMKERNGWNKKTSLRMIKKVYDNGNRSSEMKGETKKYVLKREVYHPEDEYVMYGQNLYIFKSNVLVTVFPVHTLDYSRNDILLEA